MPDSGRSAVSHRRRNRRARNRISKVADARATIDGFAHDTDIIGLTYGQFSLLDLVQAALDITGPADLAIATWSVGLHDAESTRNFVEDGKVRSVRFVMDSQEKRGQASSGEVAALFGPMAVRTTRLHAKFVLITNEAWNVVITASMNLNLNPRVEQFEMTDDAERAAMFLAFVDEVFSELPAGPTRDRQLPALHNLAGVRPKHNIEVAPPIQAGRIRVNPR